MRLKKSLGQHILTDERILNRIVSAAGVGKGDACLEIGPGTGALTRKLLDAGAAVTAVELDDRFAADLTNYAVENPGKKLTIIHRDILAIDLRAVLDSLAREGNVKVVANLPYNIASTVIIRLLEQMPPPGGMFVLTQLEVAERICAGAGGHGRSSLSVFCQARAACSLCFSVPPAAFKPPPAVVSGFMELLPYENNPLGIWDWKIFDIIVRSGFEHRRKTCYNSLRLSLEKGGGSDFGANFRELGAFLDAIFMSAAIDKSLRAQQLDNGQLAALANAASALMREKDSNTKDFFK